MYFVWLAGSGHVTASRQTSEVHQLHQHLYHHLPPPCPSPPPLLPTSHRLYDRPRRARIPPPRQAGRPGRLRRDDNGATSPSTTDATTRPAGIERAPKGTGNPKGGRGGQETGTRRGVQGTPAFFHFFFNILTLITYHRHTPPSPSSRTRRTRPRGRVLRVLRPSSCRTAKTRQKTARFCFSAPSHSTYHIHGPPFPSEHGEHAYKGVFFVFFDPLMTNSKNAP